MLNQRLKSQCESDDEYVRLNRVVSTVKTLLGEHLSEDRAVALMDVLANRTIRFVDGTVWNDPTSADSELWLAEAAVVAATLCTEPDQRWDWWKQRYLVYPKSNAAYDEVVRSVVRLFEQSQAVQDVEK